MSHSDKMNKIVSLCKRRGFVFPSSEIYGGLRSCYDYGPNGVELKRNIAAAWWRDVVSTRPDVVGLDASILMNTQVWKASGHLDNFADPLVDCLDCKERFRADKVAKVAPGTEVSYTVVEGKKKRTRTGTVGDRGYTCPACNSPNLSPERMFRGMFRTILGPVDPIGTAIKSGCEKGLVGDDLARHIEAEFERHAVYLRPETAQAMFVQFQNVQQSTAMKVPFGIAQQGKSFRNEIIVEHFVFRSCEFEQMELEFFCAPETSGEWLEYWRDERLKWHRKFVNHPDDFRARPHEADELAHYSDACYDVEYRYPWGWDELEGIASRTDYDLKKHAEHSGVKLSYFSPNEVDPETGKAPRRYVPYVIEPALGLTRLFLCVLLDAYHEETITDANGSERSRTVLKLHPQLAPVKAAVLPLVKKDGMPEMAQKIVDELRDKVGVSVSYDDQASIGKRYARHDEIGTPFCVTVDSSSLETGKVTVRHRDSAEQTTCSVAEVVELVGSRACH